MNIDIPEEGLLEFPCDYTLKVFGSASDSDAFRERVLAAVHSILPVGLDALKEKYSSGGHYLCISVLVRVYNRQQLEDLYRGLSRVEGLRYLL